jgi:hypothetical protein
LGHRIERLGLSAVFLGFDEEEGEGSLNGTKDSHLGDGYGWRSGDCDRCAGKAGAGMKEREEVMSGVDRACGTDLLVSYFFLLNFLGF